MHNLLAEKLLTKIMGWKPEEVSEERPLLQAISNFKYNEYQQFSPGIRYIESLAKWLEQFSSLDERKVAYSFVKNNLVFISADQMTHLVNIVFTDKINPILIGKTAIALNISRFKVHKLVKSESYKELLRRCIFIGLSDGSRIDQFRRSNGRISNEQVFPSYYIQKSKADDMLRELKNDGYDGQFNSLFLFDDFTASGKSYARTEGEEFKGKIIKLLDGIYSEEKNTSDDQSPYKILLSTDETLDLHIIFYLATRIAIDTIRDIITDYINHREIPVKFDIEVIQYIENEVSENVLSQKNFMNLISDDSYFDNTVVDSHYQKGKSSKPYLGFNECALPLVLNHNTPNNSLPILWFPEGSSCIGLFPRVTRHKDE